MKKEIMVFVLIGLCGATLYGVSGCKKEKEEPTASCAGNPSGTVTLNVRNAGNGDYVVSISSMGIASVGGFGSEAAFYLDASNNFQSNSSIGPNLADVGPVCGLGAVDITAGTLANSAAAQSQHGYVVKTVYGTRCRFFVVNSIIGSTSGGVIGYQIQVSQ